MNWSATVGVVGNGPSHSESREANFWAQSVHVRGINISPREDDDHHDRVLHGLKLRASGHQFGGRDSRCVSGGACGPHRVRRRPVRGTSRRAPGLPEVEAWPSRWARRGGAVASEGRVNPRAVARSASLRTHDPRHIATRGRTHFGLTGTESRRSRFAVSLGWSSRARWCSRLRFPVQQIGLVYPRAQTSASDLGECPVGRNASRGLLECQ